MNEPIDPAFFPPLPAPVAQSNVLDGLTDFDARLIFDLVAKLRPAKDTLAKYGLTPADLQAKASSKPWALAYQETQRVWSSAMSTQERIRLKAAFLLEDSLTVLHGIVTSTQMPAIQKLQAIEQLTKISSVGAKAGGAEGGEKHSITINVGGGQPARTIIAEKTNDGSGSTSTTITAV